MNTTGTSLFKGLELLLIVFFVCGNVTAVPAQADSGAAPIRSDTSKTLFNNMETQWGGYLKCRGMVSWPDDESLYGLVGTGTYYDGSVDARLKNRLYLGPSVYLDTHYEIVFLGGDARRKRKKLENILGIG